MSHRRLGRTLLVAAASLTAGVALAPAVTYAGTQISQVFVTNDQSHPVPVTAPTALPVSGSISVGNDSSHPVPVQVGNGSGNPVPVAVSNLPAVGQPWTQTLSISLENDHWSASSAIFSPPSGERVEITNVSAQTNAPDFTHLQIEGVDAGGAALYVDGGTTSGQWIANLHTLFHAASGSHNQVQVFHTAGSDTSIYTVSITLSGYAYPAS